METFDSLYEKYAAPSYRVAFLILYQGFPDRQDRLDCVSSDQMIESQVEVRWGVVPMAKHN